MIRRRGRGDSTAHLRIPRALQRAPVRGSRVRARPIHRRSRQAAAAAHPARVAAARGGCGGARGTNRARAGSPALAAAHGNPPEVFLPLLPSAGRTRPSHPGRRRASRHGRARWRSGSTMRLLRDNLPADPRRASRARTRRLIPGCLLAALLCAACGGEGARAQPCSSNTDCPSPQTCAGGRCAETACGVAAPLCAPDAGCPTGTTCQDGCCTP